MDNTNNINVKVEELLAVVRKTVLVTNMSMACALESPFTATYESDDGILIMGIKPNNSAVVIATGNDSNTVVQCDFIIVDDGLGERRSIYKCDTEQDSSDIWEILNDRIDDWVAGSIDRVSVE